MEKPMRTGPPCGVRSTAAVEVSCGWLTHAPMRKMERRMERTDALFIIGWLYHKGQ
jgi:hypothetical protein